MVAGEEDRKQYVRFSVIITFLHDIYIYTWFFSFSFDFEYVPWNDFVETASILH